MLGGGMCLMVINFMVRAIGSAEWAGNLGPYVFVLLLDDIYQCEALLANTHAALSFSIVVAGGLLRHTCMFMMKFFPVLFLQFYFTYQFLAL